MPRNPFLREGPIRQIRLDWPRTDTVSARFPLKDRRIAVGAVLEVRPDQVVQAVFLGAYGEVFGPGSHPLRRETMPTLAALDVWPFGPDQPFELDLYFLRTTPVGAVTFQTEQPVSWSRFAVSGDAAPETGVAVSGDFDARIAGPQRFLTEIAGAEEVFSIGEFRDTFRLRALGAVAEAAVAAAVTPERWRHDAETLGPALLPAVAETCRSEYGLEITRLRLAAEDVPAIPTAAGPNLRPGSREGVG